MNKTIIASLIGLLASSGVLAAQDSVKFDDVVVTATRLERKDTDTTYASEIHTRKMIEDSGATSLYDYLAQHTSVTTLPYFGNKVTPNFDMRGYGSASGFQNIVVSIDGQRLNNVDGSPQLIGAIPLSNIDRIEITKGSGSVIYGDGAMAGTIQIYTKAKTGVTTSVSGGNYGARTGNIAAGVSEKHFDLSASASDDSHDGYSKADTTGKKDTSSSTAQNIKLTLKPTEDLRFNVEGTSSRTDSRYNTSLTKAQFKNDPRQNGGGTYNHQGLDSDVWRVGIEYKITPTLKITANHIREDKLSEFFTFSARYDYDYRSNDIALSYDDSTFSAVAGLQTFDGERISNNDKTSKNNAAAFIYTEYRWEALTFSAGARREKVSYDYNPNAGINLDDDQKLNAWDLGTNYRFSKEVSLFANYNSAYQAPDIDRFFSGGTFNGFIVPAKARTLNIGLNHVADRNRLKVTAFRSNLKDEIYYYNTGSWLTSYNTNIDKSHKYGIEVQDHFKVSDKLNSSIIYTYTRAIIDKEADGGSAFDGKNVPGVSKHAVVANLGYSFWENANVNLSHVWRSSAYAADDFANNFSQKQGSYESTNLALSYRYKNLQWFTAINNIFEHKNSIQISDDVIYPVDFLRTLRVGMKADF